MITYEISTSQFISVWQAGGGTYNGVQQYIKQTFRADVDLSLTNRKKSYWGTIDFYDEMYYTWFILRHGI